jgi:uroporphyrinogen decarboxylase
VTYSNEIPDRMTPKARLAAFVAGEPYDRIPCGAMLSEHAAMVLGVTVADYHHSADLMARGQIAAYRTYGHDGIVVGPGLAGVAEAAGSLISFPEYATPFVSEYAIKEPADLERLEIPDPVSRGRYAIILDAASRMAAELGDEVPVSVQVAGAFSTASNLRGAESFMRDIRRNPEFAHRLLEYALAATVAFVREAGKLPVAIGLGDPVASGSLISPKVYRDFALPYQQRLVAEIVAATGCASVLHICGNTRRNWELMAETGSGVLSLDNVIDLAEAKAAVGDRIIVSGNVRPAETMYLGTPETVEENVKECLRKAWDSPKGFILSVGCGLPITTPPDNVHALVRAARRYGQYPYDPSLFAA